MITDELRAWIERYTMSGQRYRELIAIVDRIDAEHEKAVERARMDGMDATFGNGWVKLPVDADGVPIKVGDELECPMDSHGTVYSMTVGRICYDGEGWTVEDDCGEYDVTNLHHVKPDSWERIIADALMREDGSYYSSIDNYKKRLAELVDRCKRLAGEDA